ncbi:isopenicillin N synthase family dioxygenase [Almyronema epifaneia]|uniref:Isopenicillin N synthase family dioxygenase n=1 Tax=Almyronema epifaneia S1 TaxID=2991925 RepID=A0ABW6IG24_9CYAN
MPETQGDRAIPLLNFKAFTQGTQTERADFVDNLGQALEKIGFFALEQHSVAAPLIQQAYEAAALVFQLPDAIKQQYERPELKGQRGFVGFGREHAKNSPYPDLKEFWHVGRSPSALGANLWPVEVPQFQTVMTALFQQLEVCAAVLLEACALYLDQPRTALRDLVRQGDTLLRVIHYPPLPSTAAAASLRAAAHEDINLITLLCEATAPGLELLQTNGDWLPIQAPPGHLIVDTGDMLQHLTNGLFKSTTHRVVNPENQGDRRFSLPFFVHPAATTNLAPLAVCIDRTGGIARYPAVSAGDYLHQRLQEIGLA